MKIAIFVLLFTGVSCQNYVKNMHRNISVEKRVKESRGGAPAGKQLNYLRTSLFDKRPIKDPISFSTTPGGDLKPSVKREYRTYKKRHTVNDLADNSSSSSLWASNDNSASLFAVNKRKNQGDIVVLNVNKKLKEDISRELRKAFPKKAPPPIPNKGPASAANNAEKPKAEEDKEEAVIIFDKVSSQVSEEVGQDHLILKGRKEVYFRNQKRLIEVHALAKRSNINANDEVMSDHITESKIFVIR